MWSVIAKVIAVAVGLVILNAALNWLTRERPRDYRKRASAGVGNALLEIQSLLEPDRDHVLEERQSKAQEQDQSGEPPESERRC